MFGAPPPLSPFTSGLRVRKRAPGPRSEPRAPAATSIHPRWQRLCHGRCALGLLVSPGRSWHCHPGPPGECPRREPPGRVPGSVFSPPGAPGALGTVLGVGGAGNSVFSACCVAMRLSARLLGAGGADFPAMQWGILSVHELLLCRLEGLSTDSFFCA